MGTSSSTSGARRKPAHHVVLVGLMGCGKSTIGRLVADALGRPFHDSDATLAREQGGTAAEILSLAGAPGLHELEAAALQAALRSPAPSVIAAAASTIDDPGCRRALRRDDVAVAWLRADASVLASRFADGRHRPAFGPDPATFLRDQARLRDRRFRAVRPLVVVDTAGGTATDAASAILCVLPAASAR